MDINNRLTTRFQDKTIKIIFNFENKTIEGMSINVSSKGICVLLPVKIEVNFVATFQLNFNFEGNLVKEEVVSKVIWVIDLGNNEILVGLAYLDTSKLDKYNSYLNFLYKKEIEEKNEQ